MDFFTKMNTGIKMPTYDDKKYEECLKSLNMNWSKEEHDFLWEAMKIYEGNFYIIADRWPAKFI